MSRVGKCFDERMTSNCENWAGRGLCTGIRGWKAYMEENCRKTCGFCKSSGESLFLQFAVHMSVRGMVHFLNIFSSLLAGIALSLENSWYKGTSLSKLGI